LKGTSSCTGVRRKKRQCTEPAFGDCIGGSRFTDIAR
jgi:hypothetical protein